MIFLGKIEGRTGKFLPGRSQRGYALILVLGLLVICALMVIVMLERSTGSVKSTAAYSQVSQVRALSDMALNVVKAQIWEATTTGQTTSTALAQRSTWASQPGAIRLYGPNDAAPVIYKLYSSPTLMTNDADLSGDVPASWVSRSTEYTDLNQPVTDGASTRYPIMDPGAAASNLGATGIVDGFEIKGAPVATGANANAGPMPVRWIYVLEDGTLCQLGDPRINRDSNPLIGRIAFWTDDETAKVNLNTASPTTKASFWDAPRANASGESDLFAWRQPSQNEYQRYPGHPAMVSLRPILGDLGSLGSSDFFDLTPRYRWGGSEDGAQRITAARTSLLTNKEDRLYVTNDELLFDSSSVGLRSPVSADQLGSLGFFLTSSSRAPELNLFGQPRVTIWPVHLDPSPTRRTPFDNLIAFSSRVGGKNYFFARAEPMSPTYDFDEIERNTQLYAYLQKLTDTSVPGFGGPSFATKYDDDRDQILTQIFDYIRITNLNETYEGRDPNFKSYTPDWPDGVMQNTTASYPPDAEGRGAGLVVPIEIGNTRGMGRFPVITEVGLFFIVHSEFKPGAPPNRSNPAVNKPNAPHSDNLLQLEAMLVMETITPAFGYMPWYGRDIQIEVVSSTVMAQVGTKSISLFPPGLDPRPIYYPPAMQEGLSPGGYDGAGYIYGIDGTRVSGNGGDRTSWRFLSAPLTLDPPPVETEFSIVGGSMIINIRAAGTVVQTYNFEFPDAPNLPMPQLNPADYAYLWTIPSGKPWWQSRFNVSSPRGPGSNDVLQSLELTHGDARLVAGMKDIPSSMFFKHINYGAEALAHGLRATGNGGPTIHWEAGVNGTYVDLPSFSKVYPAGGANRQSSRPKISSRVSDLRDEGWSGDFDNGWFRYLDGPFINKPDEGMKSLTPAGLGGGSRVPYESFRWSIADGLFSPLRQVPSAVMFGSLPTGVKEGIPWRTLLFCPNPSDPGHRGFDDPPDHLLLDLFRMPVVEPYSISGPASTDGKINMNYAIAPFSYIRRQSAWYAALEALKIFAIPDGESAKYKEGGSVINMRKSVNVEETLKQFESRFASNEIFSSATEICSLFLVPEGETLAGVSNLNSGYWSQHRLTGDNSREKPYAELYPKLTTQSNTYRLHLRVQMIPEAGAAPTNGIDFVPLAEYRGSILLERYLDLEDDRLLNNSVDPDEDSLNELYKFRVLETLRFSQ